MEKKRLIALLLSVLMVFAMLPSMAMAESQTKEECDAVGNCQHEATVKSNGVITHYDTYLEAVEAAVDGSVITLLKNVDLTDVAPNRACEVLNFNNTTLDMNNHEIKHNFMAYLYDGTNFTIKNGKFDGNGSDYGLFIGEKGVLNAVIDNVELVGGFNIYNAYNVVLRNVKAHGLSYYALWLDSDTEVTVESGEFIGGQNTVIGIADAEDSSGSDLTINGGNFSKGTGLVLGENNPNSVFGRPVIYGGTFDRDPSAFVGENTNVTKTGESTWVVRKNTPPAPPSEPVKPPVVVEPDNGNVEAVVKPDSTGKVETTIPESIVEESLDKVTTEKPGEEGKAPVVEIVVKEETSSDANETKTVVVTVPSKAVEKVAAVEDATIKVSSSVGNVELDNNVLENVSKEAKDENITIIIEKADVDGTTEDGPKLNEAQQATVEKLGKEEHVYDLTIMVGQKVIHELGGKAKFEFKYTLKKGEIADGVRVYYIDEKGKKFKKDTTYNKDTETITMVTDHFSIYAVSYVDVPTKVKVLKAKSEGGKAALRWSRATNGADGYRVYRAKTKDGKYSPIAWVKDGKAKTFKEKAKKTNKTYYYKVRAYKNVDGKKVWGEYSPAKKVVFK